MSRHTSNPTLARTAVVEPQSLQVFARPNLTLFWAHPNRGGGVLERFWGPRGDESPVDCQHGREVDVKGAVGIDVQSAGGMCHALGFAGRNFGS